MLLTLVVHQPQALLQIVQQTPRWVWGLLAALLWLGASQLFDRTASLRRVVLMPVAMAALSIYGVASAFAGAAQTGVAVGLWALVALTTASVAVWWQSTAPAGARYCAASRRFDLPGSAMPLALIMGIFLTKYLVGVELAMQPALARDSAFALQIAALYGAFSGLFAARALRLLRLAHSAGPAGLMAAAPHIA